jgi:hypothetical protein
VLRAPRLGWKDKADLLVFTEEAREITDFKTGARDDAHKFQVPAAAVLSDRLERRTRAEPAAIVDQY